MSSPVPQFLGHNQSQGNTPTNVCYISNEFVPLSNVHVSMPVETDNQTKKRCIQSSETISFKDVSVVGTYIPHYLCHPGVNTNTCSTVPIHPSNSESSNFDTFNYSHIHQGSLSYDNPTQNRHSVACTSSAVNMNLI